MAGMSSLVRIVNAGVPGSQNRVDVVLRDGKLFPRHESSISDSMRHIIMMLCYQHADTPA